MEVHKRAVTACVWVQTDDEHMDQNWYYSVMTLSDPLNFQNFYSFLFFAFYGVWALYYRMRLKRGEPLQPRGLRPTEKGADPLRGVKTLRSGGQSPLIKKDISSFFSYNLFLSVGAQPHGVEGVHPFRNKIRWRHIGQIFWLLL